MGSDGRIQVLFPDEYIELQREIPKHPVLVEFLQDHPVNEFEIRLSQIAAYCEVALDDTYSQDDLKNLAKILTKRLIEKRSGLILIEGRSQ